MTTKIFFVRHGEVDNPNKILYGRLQGFPLSQNGKDQITKTAHILLKENISAIYSSPLLRTKQTAEIISVILHLPINYSEEILEVKTSLQGKTFSYVDSYFPKMNVYAAVKDNPSDETIEDIAKRMQKFITEMKKTYQGKNIVAVTHGDPIMIVKAQLENLPISIDSLRPANGYIQEGQIYLAEFKSP